jgi:hemoglobin
MESLFDRLGGVKALSAVVDVFYERVLADGRVSRFFDGVDMSRQAAKQKAFLAMVTGGPTNYTGKNMRDAHQHMDLNDTHVDAIIEILGATLGEFGVSDEDVGACAVIAESVRDDVLNRNAASS